MSSNLSVPRGHRRDRRAGQIPATQPMSPISYSPPIYNLLAEEGIERLHQASMRILSEFGIAFYDEESRTILKTHGVRLDGDLAYFEPELVKEYVGKAPHCFTQLARNSKNNLDMGGDRMVFAPV